jgi:hypothetical protein
MGSLGGHILPGTFFGIFAIFWSFITSIRYVQSRQKSQLSTKNTAKDHRLVGYRTSVSMPCLCLPSRRLREAPGESYVKLVFTFIGILVEFVAGFDFHHVPGFNKDDASLFGCGSDGMSHGHAASAGHVQNHAAHNNGSGTSSTNNPPVLTEVSFSFNNIQHITMYSGNFFISLEMRSLI